MVVVGAMVEIDVVVAGDGEGRAVGGEGVVGYGGVEEVVDFWGGHADVAKMIA